MEMIVPIYALIEVGEGEFKVAEEVFVIGVMLDEGDGEDTAGDYFGVELGADGEGSFKDGGGILWLAIGYEV